MQICYIPYKDEYQVYAERKLNKELKTIKDRKTRNQLLACIALIATTNIKTLAETVDNELAIEVFEASVNSAGGQILHLIQIVGYWYALFAAAIQIIKRLHNEDISGIVGIGIKYALMYTTLYLLPWLFKLIAGLFPVI